MRRRGSIGRSKSFRDFFERQSRVHLENSEFIHDEKGNIIGGKAPNLKKIREFYKKQAKFDRIRKRK